MKTCIDSAISTLRKAVDSNRETDVSDMKRSSDEKMRDLTEKYTAAAPTTIQIHATGTMSNCRPWNYSDYLMRLQSFRDTTKWFAKPACMSPLECAALGWSCHTSQPDSLVCHCCGAVLVHNTQGDASGAAMARQLSNGHSPECGWHPTAPNIDTSSSPTGTVHTDASFDVITTTAVACDPSFKDIPGLSSAVRTCELALQRALSLLSIVDNVVQCSTSTSTTAVLISMHASTVIDSGGKDPQVCLPLQLPATVPDRTRTALHTALRMLSHHSTASINTHAHTSACAALEAPAELTAAVLHLCNAGAGVCNNAQNEVLQAVLRLAVCGWEHTNTTLVSKTAAGASPVTTTAAPTISCKLCGRCVSLKPYSRTYTDTDEHSASLDPVSQHRYFCPYVNSPAQWPSWCTEKVHHTASAGVCHSKDSDDGDGNGNSDPVGWQLVLSAVAQLLVCKSHVVDSVGTGSGAVHSTMVLDKDVMSADVCSSGSKRLADVSRDSDEGNGEGAAMIVDPAVAYKRIRSVLDLVVAK